MENKLIEECAKMYAKSLILYGVDISGKFETATQISFALDKAYLRGREETLKYECERLKKDYTWIPVKERLPKSEGFYLASIKLSYDSKVKILWFSENYNSFMEYGNSVIAWMPLPETYRE